MSEEFAKAQEEAVDASLEYTGRIVQSMMQGCSQQEKVRAAHASEKALAIIQEQAKHGNAVLYLCAFLVIEAIFKNFKESMKSFNNMQRSPAANDTPDNTGKPS